MRRVLEWAALHDTEILITDLPRRVGARYHVDARQIEVANDLNDLERLAILRRVVAAGKQRCVSCQAGAHILEVPDVVPLPIGCDCSRRSRCPAGDPVTGELFVGRG